MKKFEIKTASVEIKTNGHKSFSADEILNAFLSGTCLETETVAEFPTLEEAQATFAQKFQNFGKTEFMKWTIPFLAADIAFIEENDYDEDGFWDNGGVIWDLAAEAYTSKEE